MVAAQGETITNGTPDGNTGQRRPLRASTGLKQWMLWVDADGILARKYSGIETIKLLLNRLMGVPRDPGFAFDPESTGHAGSYWYPRSQLNQVRLVFRGTTMLELRSVTGTFRWFLIREGQDRFARQVFQQSFADIYEERGFGRVWRALNRPPRPGD